jgi:DNA-binding MarR family transcriptional regulator
MDKMSFNHSLFQFISDTQSIGYDLTQNFKPEGITQRAFSILELLYDYKDKTVNEVSENLTISNSMVRRALKDLLEKKYISKGKQGRFNVYKITKQGKIKLDACFFQIVNSIDNKFDDIDEDTRGHLVECMAYITKKLYK